MADEPSNLETALVDLTMRAFGRPLYRGFVDSLALAGGERVLDFGSGWGMNSLLIAERLGKGGRLTCLDVSSRWLEVAKRRLRGMGNVDFVLGDISQADFEDGTFDLIVVHLVLHHVDPPAREKTVGAMSRALKEGGRLVILDPIGGDHGTPPGEIRQLLTGAGLKESAWSTSRWHLMTIAYRGTWVKPQCTPDVCEVPAELPAQRP